MILSFHKGLWSAGCVQSIELDAGGQWDQRDHSSALLEHAEPLGPAHRAWGTVRFNKKELFVVTIVAFCHYLNYGTQGDPSTFPLEKEDLRGSQYATLKASFSIFHPHEPHIW